MGRFDASQNVRFATDFWSSVWLCLFLKYAIAVPSHILDPCLLQRKACIALIETFNSLQESLYHYADYLTALTQGPAIRDLLTTSTLPKRACEICGKLVSSSNMCRHLALHTATVWTVRCKKCNGLIKHKRNLKRHEETCGKLPNS